MGKRAEAEPHVVAARAAESSAEFEQARAAMALAIEACPEDAELYAMMAWYTHRSNSLDPSERARLTRHHLGRALEIDPRQPLAHLYQGRVYVEEGNAARARVELSAALAADPGLAAARHELERLDAKHKGTAPAAGAGRPRPAGHRAGRMLVLVTLVFAGLLANAAIFLFDTERAELRTLSVDLGTSIRLSDSSRLGPLLWVEVGDAWDSLAPAERSTELGAIAAAMPAMKLDEVKILRGGSVVAEIRAGKICAEPSCLTDRDPNRI